MAADIRDGTMVYASSWLERDGMDMRIDFAGVVIERVHGTQLVVAGVSHVPVLHVTVLVA